MNVYGVTGWKNAGKTGLMERLVTEITGRGFSVSTVKHAHHSFDVDQPGRDSHRHRVAGATEVLLSSGFRWALMHELRGAEEPDLASLLARLTPVDLVLIEGAGSPAETNLRRGDIACKAVVQFQGYGSRHRVDMMPIFLMQPLAGL